MRKFGLSLVLMGVLGASSAFAEESGVFIGAQLANAKTNVKSEDSGYSYKYDYTTTGYGFLVGYKQFFNDKFGARYYGLFNYTTIGATYGDIGAFSLNANADALFNFASVKVFEFGAFAGLSLGYVGYVTYDVDNFDTVSGLDLGINAGVRVSIAERHGVELYSRFGLTEAKSTDDYGETLKLKQPYSLGLRYTFTF